MIFVWIYFWIAAMVAAYLFVKSGGNGAPWIHARNSVLYGIFWLPIVLFYVWIIFLFRMAMSGDE